MDKEEIKPPRVDSDNDDYVNEETKEPKPLDEILASSEICSLENGNVKIHLGSNTLRVDILCNLALEFQKRLTKQNGKNNSPKYIT